MAVGDHSTVEGPVVNVIGDNSLIHQGSNYMVPSQTMGDDKPASQLVSANESILAQGKDAESDFMPKYETICKFVKAAGPEGCLVMERELNALRDKQLEIVAKKKNSSCIHDDPFNNFRHIFKNLCGHTNNAGDEGRQALMEGLNKLQTMQVDIITRGGGGQAQERHQCHKPAKRE